MTAVAIERVKLEQALEALEKCRYRALADKIVDPAIATIKEALAQPQHELVAIHQWRFKANGPLEPWHDDTHERAYHSSPRIEGRTVYAIAQSEHIPDAKKMVAQPEQERPHIGWLARHIDGSCRLLTDLEIAASNGLWKGEFKLYSEAQPHHIATAGKVIEPQQEPVAWSDAKQSELNDWFLSLPDGKRTVLLEDKWMLAGAAFLAGKSSTPPQRKPLTDDEAFKLIEQDYKMEEYAQAALQLIRRAEAAHGIKGDAC